jgi:hypothetical protein
MRIDPAALPGCLKAELQDSPEPVKIFPMNPQNLEYGAT